MKPLPLLTLTLAASLVGSVGCKNDNADQGGANANLIEVDGSSTVYPISEAIAEEFQKQNDARVTIGVSGTGGGFQKFCNKETVLTGASRPIKPSEAEKCAQAGVEFIEVPVAYDGITVIVHPDNDWAETMTVDELETIWGPEAQGKIHRWSQVRDDWPDQEIQLFAPGTASGTFDYFTHAVMGEEQASRGDFSPSEDDNVIVQGVSRSKNALGFLGFAYFDENRDSLKAVNIVSPATDEPVSPSMETIANGTYQPLSRPLFIYVRKDALDSNESLRKYVDFYLNDGAELVKEVGFIPLPDNAYDLAEQRVADGTTGSVFEHGSQVGVTVEELLGGNKPTADADNAAPTEETSEETSEEAGE